MKIILSTVSQSLDSPVDPRFGRSAYFLLVDSDTLEAWSYNNPGMGVAGGAGTLAAQFITSLNAKAVISGNFGPNAHDALQAAGITMYQFGSCRTAREAVEQFKAGQLELSSPSTGPGRRGRF
jgi:predicted Fe-Mo cluster-binding NifX family protein